MDIKLPSYKMFKLLRKWQQKQMKKLEPGGMPYAESFLNELK